MDPKNIQIGEGLSLRIMVIDPEHAEHLLEKYTKNRTISKVHMIKYATDMMQGLWRFNAVPILISKDGEIMDGQHRLKAIIKSGVSQKIVVIWGVDKSAFMTIDQGKPRSGGDVLSIIGLSKEKSTAISALIIKRYNFYNGRIGTMGNAGRIYNSSNINNRAAMNNEMIIGEYEGKKAFYDEIYYKFSEFKIDDRNTIKHSFKKIGGWRNPFVIYSILYEINSTAANDFIKKLALGSGLQDGSPILFLRNKIIELMNYDKKISYRELVIFYLKSWNAYRLGQKVSHFIVKEGDKIPDII
jgi:hypothetical protein